MPPLDVILLRSATDNLDGLIRFIVANGASVRSARAFTMRIRSRCRAIADAPHGGRPREDLAPGLRSIAFERRAIIIYRVAQSRIEVINIFYGGRDYEVLYRDEGADS